MFQIVVDFTMDKNLMLVVKARDKSVPGSVEFEVKLPVSQCLFTHYLLFLRLIKGRED